MARDSASDRNDSSSGSALQSETPANVSLVTRKSVLLIAGVMIVSASAGVLWGAGELFVGRGVIVKELRSDSPLRGATPLREGDAVWRVNGRRVSSVAEIDEVLWINPASPPDIPLAPLTRDYVLPLASRALFNQNRSGSNAATANYLHKGNSIPL